MSSCAELRMKCVNCANKAGESTTQHIRLRLWFVRVFRVLATVHVPHELGVHFQLMQPLRARAFGRQLQLLERPGWRAVGGEGR